MGRLLALILLAAGAPEPEGPDGMLVMGVVGRGDSASAVHGERAVVADPRTGAVRARRLPGGTLCGGPIHAAGDRVVYSSYSGFHGEALSLPLDLTGPPRSLGRADTVTPSARQGRLWLGRLRHRASSTRAALREVEVAGNGAVSVTTGPLPRWSRIEHALPGGFIVGSGRRLALWDRGLDRRLWSARDAWVLAAGRTGFAWCDARCRDVRVWSEDGRRRFAPPAGTRLYGGLEGAPSPDGSRLAMPLTAGGRRWAAVLDLADGSWTMVPHGRLHGYGAIAWSPSGRWLYFAGPERRLHAWRLGATASRRLPVDPGGTVMSIATAG